MKAVVLLFTKPTRGGSEEFVFPKLTSVKMTIEGVPNMIYSQGLSKSRFFCEAQRLFEWDQKDPSMDVRSYF